MREFKLLFVAVPFAPGNVNFGSRLALDRNGYLYITLGDRAKWDSAQELDSYHGSVIRLTEDRRVPPDNPFTDRDGALPGIWSYRHRNPQGLVMHPETGILWLLEHGPRGGDELNIPKRGGNHGWPKVTFGREYRSDEQIGDRKSTRLNSSHER